MILPRKMTLLKGKILLFILLILVFWKFFAPGPKVANDFPYVFTESLKEGFAWPSTWSARGGEGMGEQALLTMWAWPIDFFYGLGASLGLTFDMLERIFGPLAILIIGIFSINKLLKKYELTNSAIFVSSFFYLTTSYLILLIDGGQMQIALAYVLMPLSFLLIQEGVSGNLVQKIKAGLGVSLMGFLDIRFVYVLLVLSVFWNLYEFIILTENKFALVKNIFLTGVVITLTFLGLNFYWILPLFLIKSNSVTSTFNRLTETSFLSFATWKHALLLLQPHWYKNVFGKVAAVDDYKEFLLIPLLVFSAPLVIYLNKSKERIKKLRILPFWLFIAIVSIFLVKGSNPPFGHIYPWLYENIPGFSLFRDSTKFFFLISLSYSVLIGFTVDGIVKKMNWKLSVIPLLLTTYFLLLIRPVWTNRMTGTFSDPIYKEEFIRVAEALKNDKNFGRVFWIPSRAPLGFVSPDHPSAEASRFFSKRPFAIGNVGTYEIFNFLREASYMGELFKISGIEYIAYPYPDTRREELKPDSIDYYYAFLDQLSNLPWIKGSVTNPPVSVLKTKKDVEHFYLAENTFLIVGSDRIYDELVGIEGFNLPQNAILFAEEAPKAYFENLGNPNTKIILFEKDDLDFLMSTITEDKFIFPAKYLSPNPDEMGWWMRDTAGFLWWRNFLQEKYALDYQEFDYGGGWVVGEGDRELTVRSDNLHSGDMVFARVMNSKRGGVLEFAQGETELNGSIATNGECLRKTFIKLTGYKKIPDKFFEYDCAFLFWIYVGKIDKDGEITIKTRGDLNVVNALISIPEEELNLYRDKINQYEVYSWNDLDSEQKSELFTGFSDSSIDDSRFTNNKRSGLSYTKISPAHYKVSIKGLEGSATLVFSESYDSLWRIENVQTGEKESSYPLYSLINGFYIEKDGEYDIYFSPQKYVYPGMIGSGLTLFLAVSTLIISRKKKY